jgi:putative DNA primase/helicase
MGNLNEAARGRWPGILASLAGLSDQQLSDVHQPCPLCGGEDRYRFDDIDGSGSWFCNRCGGRNQTGGAGTGMDMLMRRTGWSFKDAATRVEQHLGIAPQTVQAQAKGRPARTPDRPPADAPPPPLDGAAAQWPYTDSSGATLFWIQRVNLRKSGGKLFLHRTWIDGAWHRPSKNDAFTSEWPAPRPPYGLHLLAERPQASVLIVEGEGTADAARALFPNVVILAWCGGAGGVLRTDWSALVGRRVALWPDNDAPGLRTMAKLAQHLQGLAQAPTVRIVLPPADAPEKWDLADATDWTPAHAVAHVKASTTADVQAFIDAHLAPAQPELAPTPPTPEDPQPAPVPSGTGGHFRCLGFDGDDFFYLPSATGQVVRLTAAQHGGSGLLRLAPLPFWETLYPGGRGGVNWNAAMSSLYQQQATVGVYDPDRIRGRGAWRDNGRVVFHLGDRLIVDGQAHSVLSPPKTRYFYEQARQLDGPSDTPMDDDTAATIRAIAERFRWEVPATFHLLLGWIVLAPVCGALAWRPHIWITGGAGTGKTTILKLFIHPLLGGIVQSATGGTTEAGLRGTLKSDAIPVVFDEFEQNEAKDKTIVQNVLALARIASSEGGKIYKGTTSGGANSFEIRSMFCVSSINVSLVQKADIDRFCVLGLRNAGMDKEEWREFHTDITNACTIDAGRALIARTVGQIPTITENSRVLAQALGRRFGQRFGDQHGTLLAGAWSLEPGGGGLLSLQQAEQWLDQMDWEQAQTDSTDADEVKCRDTILQGLVRIGGGMEASIGELVQAVAYQQMLHEVTSWSALEPVLARHGLKVYRPGTRLPDKELTDGYWLAVSNTNLQLRQALRDTPWANGSHKSSLRRLPGALVPRNPVHLGSTSNRVTLIPLPDPSP